jgi:hypothetical protein
MTSSSSAKKLAKDAFSIALVTILMFVIVDFFAGNVLLSMARKEGKKDTFRTSHPRYHHTLQPSYAGPAYWGPFSYKVCTNASGMKSDCGDTSLAEKHFDIAFIGDSFTEGVGVPYEDSFVGMVAKAHPELKIANLGVVSYSPTIYLKKLEDYLKHGYTFKKVIVFVDIGDIMDEAQYVEDSQGNALLAVEVIQPGAIAFIKRHAKKNLPLTYEGLHHTKQAFLQTRGNQVREISSDVRPDNRAAGLPKDTQSPDASNRSDSSPSTTNQQAPSPVLQTQATDTDKSGAIPTPQKVSEPTPSKKVKEPWIYDKEFARSAWTYNLDAPNYGDLGVRASIAKAVSQMELVAALLKSHNTTLSLGVYPWPAQLIFDKEESLQVEVWRKFCVDRCEDFYNAFPLFFDEVRRLGLEATIAKNYFPGDMHFGREGNALIAETILRKPLASSQLK